MRVRWRSVGVKLPATMMLAAAVPVTVLGFFAYSRTRDFLREGILKANHVAALDSALVIQERMKQARAVIQEAAIRPGLRAAVERRDYAFVTRLFTNLALTNDGFRAFVLLGPSGVVLAVGPENPSLIGKDLSRREYFARATDSKRPYASDVFTAETGNPAIAVSAPMLGADGERLAVIAGALSLKSTEALMRVAAANISGIGFVVDNHGALIAHSRGDLVAPNPGFAQLPPVRAALAGRSGTLEVWNPMEREHRLAGFAPVGDLGWAVVMARPRDEAFRPIAHLRWTLLLLVVVILIGTLIIAVVVSTGITRPLEQLAGAARRIGDGDFSTVVTIDRADEFGEVGRAFNTMAARVAALTRDLDAEVEDRTRDLIRERAHLEAILSGIGEGVCVVDTEGRVAMWNGAAERMTAVPADRMIGAIYPAALKAAYGDQVVTDFSQTVMKRALDAGEPVSTHEAHFILPDGTEVPIAATAAPIRNHSGAIVGCVNVFRDISREKDIDRMKSEFVSTVSHELRTPLTSIRAYAETLLGMVGDDETVQEFLTVIEDESVRLTRLINQLLNLSRIESRRVQFKREPVALTPLISRAIQTAQPKARANEVRIGADIAPDLPRFQGDVDAIEQVLINLVDNAVKYNRRGGLVQVRASVNGGVAVEVRDTGIGMPAAAVRRLGERFFRVDSSETRRIGGTGLGITLVKEILLAHDARLEVESEEGVGSVFRFVLPRAQAQR